jgi:hypothetical protein
MREVELNAWMMIFECPATAMPMQREDDRSRLRNSTSFQGAFARQGNNMNGRHVSAHLASFVFSFIIRRQFVIDVAYEHNPHLCVVIPP